MGGKKETASGEEYKPGQTKELPENAQDTEALTTFYTTLLQQRPDSKMAQEFCVKHGLLEWDQAEVLNKNLIKAGGGSKSASSSSKGSGSAKPKADDDDFQTKPKAKPAAKKPPAKKAEIPADDSSDEEFEEKKPAKKPPAKKAPPAAKRKPDVDDSSDEDIPLSQKKKTGKK